MFRSNSKLFILIFSFFSFLSIIVALFYGRAIEKSYPFLIYLIPAFFLLLSSGVGAFYALDIYKRTKRRRLLVPLVLYPFLSVPVANFLTTIPIEKIHLVKYSVFSFLVCYYVSLRKDKLQILFPFLLCATIGIIEESTQYYLPRRIFDLHDMVVNIASCLYGSLYLYVFWRARRG